MTMRAVTVYTRAGCHLCDEALSVVRTVAAERSASVTVLDVDADPEDRAEYGDRVPVVLVDGREHDYFRVDAERLRSALGG